MESDQLQLIGQHFKKYTFMKVLGKGSQGTVFEAIEDQGQSSVAIKVMNKKLLKENPILLQLVKNQIKILKQCKSQNVIKFIDKFQYDNYFFIVTQNCNGGDLQKLIDTEINIPEDRALMYLKQILNGFKGLHELKTMHRDFKCANVLLHNNVCKIADLGYSKQLEKNNLTNTILGTAVTMAPEILQGKSYGFQADIWSIGVVFYQMLFGKYPFQGKNQYDLLKKIKTTKPDFKSVHVSPQALNFIQCCLTLNPSQRIRWEEIYFHKLITKEEGNLLYSVKYQVNLADQQQFYTKTGLPEEQVQSWNIQDIEFEEIDEEDIRKSSKMSQKIEEHNYMKEKQKAFLQFQKIYLNRRNNIFFIFKFIAPFVSRFNFIKANHGVSLFIMSKKAYIEMKEYSELMAKRKNIFDIKNLYYKEFIGSNEYKNIYKQVCTDVQNIQMQTLCYSSDIEICNQEIQSQYDLSRVACKHFDVLVNVTVDEYWYLLVEALEKVEGQSRKDFLKIIQALSYYKERNSNNIDGQEFYKNMSTINYEEVEKRIMEKYSQIFH